jgi:multidrug efflux pump subunit AcrA (membrane-fusion protein)
MAARRRSWRLWVGVLVSIAIVAAATAGLYRMRKVQAAVNPPTSRVRKGEFAVIVRCRGELSVKRTVQLTAPNNVPDLKIVWLAPPGGPVKAHEPVIRFDPSSAKQQLDEKNAILRQAQSTVDQAVAQARITAEQDKLDLANARYQVERAKLEASKQAIVSVIQGEESKVDLESAEKKLRVQEATVNLHQKSDEAKVASLTRQRDKAQAEVDLAKQRLSQMEVKAPIEGVVIYQMNTSQGWMNRQPFKVGDHAWPNAPLADIPDLSTIRMEGKLDEVDRGRVTVSNDVRVHVDAFPEQIFATKLGGISPLTQMALEWPPTRSFRAYAQIEKPDTRLRPDMNGSMDVVTSRIANAISVPGKAIFTREGKPIVYVAQKDGTYSAVEVEILARNPDEVAVRGIHDNAVVSLTELDLENKQR